MSTPAHRPAGLAPFSRDVVRCTRGHDLALYAAGVTFYAAIGVVPLLLLSVFLAGLLIGEQPVASMADELVGLLPERLGVREAAMALVASGGRLTVPTAVAAFVPASLYGEGLVRAFDRLSVRGERGRRTLRGRLGSVVIVAVSPVLLLVGLAATSGLSRGLGSGTGAALLGTYCAFLVGWVVIGVMLVFAYRGLAPQRPGLRALLWGAFGTSSIVSGFCLGYLLFLGIEVPVVGPYGGSEPLAAAAVTLLWLYLLHVLVLVGYVATLRLAARQGHPLGPLLEEGTVRVGAHALEGDEPAVAA